jgi:hypothetical protein
LKLAAPEKMATCALPPGPPKEEPLKRPLIRIGESIAS